MLKSQTFVNSGKAEAGLAMSGDERPGENRNEVTSTFFEDARPTAVGSGRPFGGSDNAQSVPTVMPEEPFSAKDFLKKPIVIRNVQWTTAQAPDTNLLSGTSGLTAILDIPAVLAETTNIQHQMLATFAFFKMALRLRVVVNTTRLHQGKLIISYDPFNGMVEGAPQNGSPKKYFDRVKATMLPNAQIDAARSNVCNIDIPWEHIQDYLTTNSKDSFDIMGRVRITVLNQLQVATGGVTSANVQVFLSATDVNVNVPIQPHTTQIPSLFAQIDNFNLANAVEDVVGGAMQGVAGLASGNIVGAISGAVKAFTGFNELAGFNFDKPADKEASLHNTIAPQSALAHMKGLDSSVRLGTQPGGGYVCHQKFSGAPDSEMVLSRVAARKGFVKTVRWETSQVPGTILERLPVMPGLCATDPTKPSRNINNFLSYVASFFTFWRGSIEYEIDFVSSLFQAGRIGVAFIPNAVPTFTPDLTELSNFPTAYFELEGELKRHAWRIPYQSAVPRKIFVPYATNPSGSDYTDNHITGYFYIFVANQLSANDSVVNFIEFNLYTGAGPDFEMDVPRVRPETKFFEPILLPPPPPQAVAQSSFNRANACDEPTEGTGNVGPKADPTTAAEQPPQETACGVDNDMQSREAAPIPINDMMAGSMKVARMNAFLEGAMTAKDMARRFTKVWQVFIPMGYQYGTEQNFGPLLYTGSQPNPVVPPERPLVGILRIPVKPGIGSMFSPADYNITDWSGNVPKDGITYAQGASSTTVFVDAMSRMYALWSGGLRFKIQPLSNRSSGITWTASYVFDNREFVPTFNGVASFGNYSSYPTHSGNFSQNAAIEVETPFYSVYNQLVVNTESLADPNALSNGELFLQFQARPDDPGLTTISEAFWLYDPYEQRAKPVLAGTKGFTLNIYMAGADDIRYAYLVAPPDTYSSEQLVPPPASSLNSERSKRRRAAIRRKMQRLKHVLFSPSVEDVNEDGEDTVA